MIYSFDDCSILNTCEVEIPRAYRFFSRKDKLRSRNFSKLNLLITKLNSLKITKFRFVPSTIQNNIVGAARQLIEEEEINTQMLGRNFEAQIMGQLEEFSSKIEKEFEGIEKNEDIDLIKKFFSANEKGLIKEKNLPEDDDMKILSGYINFQNEGRKYFITHDEHFWGYKDLILKEFKIMVVEEWNCNGLSLS